MYPLISCYVAILVPLVLTANNLTSPLKTKSESNSTTLLVPKPKTLAPIDVKTGTVLKPTMVSEGGTISDNNTLIAQKISDDVAKAMNNETSSTISKVKGRKGVAETNVNGTVAGDANESSKKDITILSPVTVSNNTTKNNKTIETVNTTDVNNISAKVTKPRNKPLVTVYEDLEASFESDKIPPKSSSTTSFVDNLMPLPHKDSTKYLPNGHPGMVLPIVITILVVPMFAVIGYMALTRGREAWRNRHYKRMDFLLDGMYND